MHVDDLVLGWQGIAELVDVTERDARLHTPKTGASLLCLALDVTMYVKYCHIFRFDFTKLVQQKSKRRKISPFLRVTA
jgi:hypothetical protein